MPKTVNEKLIAQGGVQVPAGASAGKFAITDASGNVSWHTIGTADLPSSVVTGTSAPHLDQNFSQQSPTLGPLTSPIFMTVASGTFTARAPSVDFNVALSNIVYASPLAGNIVQQLYVAPHGTTPLARSAQGGGGLTAGVQEFILGLAPGAGQGTVTGLTVGNQYDWALTVGIVGYYWGFAIPEAPTSISITPLLSPLSADRSYPPFEETIVAMGSATKLHLLRSNHVVGVYDYVTTGNGFALRGGRTTGAVAISPNGKYVAVSNYTQGNVDIYDISTAATVAAPVLIGTVTTVATPVAITWDPTSSVIYTAQYASSGTPNWTPIATTALSSALSTGGAITSLPVTALPYALPNGGSVVVTDPSGAHTQTWTLTALAAKGATTLTVASQTPNFAYPAGTPGAGVGSMVAAAGTNQALDTGALTINAAQVTPDGTKLCLSASTGLYIVTVPAATFVKTAVAGNAVIASNTTGYLVVAGTKVLYNVTLSTGATASLFTDTALPGSPIAMAIQPDKQTVYAFTNVSGVAGVREYDLRTGQTLGNLYTSWGAPNGVGGNGPIGQAAISGLGDFFVTVGAFMNVWPGGLFQMTALGYGHTAAVCFSPAT